MQSLPGIPYEFSLWKTATVQLNYHIAFDNQYYSVPYAYVRKKVDIRSAKSLVEVFYQNTRVYSHRRLYGRKGQYDTNPVTYRRIISSTASGITSGKCMQSGS